MKLIICIMTVLVGYAASDCDILAAKSCLSDYSITEVASLCKFLKNGQPITDCVRNKTGCIPDTVPEFTTIKSAAETINLIGKCNSGIVAQPMITTMMLLVGLCLLVMTR